MKRALLIISVCVLLAAAYAGSSLAAIGEMLIMNNVVSKHFTCAIRIRMSDKIRRLPVRYVDQTPNGEIISHMTDDVSTMGCRFFPRRQNQPLPSW